MCLFTNQAYPLFAKEDIYVYKHCDVINNKLYASYRHNYRYSKIEKAKIKHKFMHEWGVPNYVVTRGLHADRNCNCSSNTEWIIPKGSEYYISLLKDEIVSNEMIFNKFLNETNPDVIKWKEPSIFHKKFRKIICRFKKFKLSL